MRRMFVWLAACAAALCAQAQQKADIEVGYTCVKPVMTGGSKETKMRLLANASQSKYFNDISLWVDSLSSTPEGEAKYNEILKASCMVMHPDGYAFWDLTKGPVKNVNLYVFTNAADGTLTVYDNWADEDGCYTEPADEMEWTVEPDSTAEVLGYQCVMATTDYHGRRWKAWFAPDIPMAFGPWKLHGLPGLILKAEADGGFSFIANGLQTTDRIISPMYSASGYKTVDRRKAQADDEYFFNNQEAILKAQNGGRARIIYTDDNGNEIAKPEYMAAKHSLEPDYSK